MQTRIGNVPSDALGCWYIGTADSGTLDGWALVRRATYKPSAGWENFKLISYRPMKGAANYWLAWHTDEKRLARTAELARMPAALRDEVCAVLSDPLLAADMTAAAEAAMLAELRALMGAWAPADPMAAMLS